VSTFVDVTFDIAKEVEAVANSLASQSDTFWWLGQDRTAARMESMSKTLNAAAERLRKVVSEKTTQDFRDAEQSALNTLNGVMAGLKIGTGPKQEDV
jgi:hypothetical protein